MSDYFDSFIGQAAVKRRLTFFINDYKKTYQLPPILLSTAKGGGKTSIAKMLAKHLNHKHLDSIRPLVEVNCSVIKSMKQWASLYNQYIHNNDVTLLLDEASELPHDVSMALLTILNTGGNPVREFKHEDITQIWDFTRCSIIFATTEPDKVNHALIDRLTVVEFEAYSPKELGEIVRLNVAANNPDVTISDEVMDVLIKTVRGNPRSAVHAANNICAYLRQVETNELTIQGWHDLCHNLDINKNGLQHSEVIVLRALVNRGGSASLQALSAMTGLTRTALQRGVENFLLARGFLEIKGNRHITHEGRLALKELEEKVVLS